MRLCQHGLSYDGCIALSDPELVRLAFDFAASAPGLDGDEAMDGMCVFLDEIFERFAPELAVAEKLRFYRDPEFYDDDLVDAEANLADSLNAIRLRQASRTLRDLLGSGAPDA